MSVADGKIVAQVGCEAHTSVRKPWWMISPKTPLRRLFSSVFSAMLPASPQRVADSSATQRISSRRVRLGDSITLSCPRNKVTELLYWYKQPGGSMPQQVSSSINYKTQLHGHFSNNSRFTDVCFILH